MTPKEKARELIEKFQFVEIANYTSMFEVKQCALIAVDEILNVGFMDTNDLYDYWQEVRKEIEKL